VTVTLAELSCRFQQHFDKWLRHVIFAIVIGVTVLDITTQREKAYIPPSIFALLYYSMYLNSKKTGLMITFIAMAYISVAISIFGQYPQSDFVRVAWLIPGFVGLIYGVVRVRADRPKC